MLKQLLKQARPTESGFPAFPTRKLTSLLLLSGLSSMALVPIACADTAQVSQAGQPFAIAAGPLDQVLNVFARETGILLVIDAELTTGKTSEGLHGHFDLRAGLDRILRGTQLQAIGQANGSYMLKRTQTVGQAAAKEETLPAVEVKANRTRESVTELPAAYAGGQVASGARIGMLGNRDFMDTPFNITSYTAQTIRDQQATSLVDVVANDPAVRVTTNGLTSAAGQGDGFMIRGFRTYSSDVLFDGVAGIAMINTFPVEALERVEIMKGPSAMLSGMGQRGGVGGTINVVPKRASEEDLNRLSFSYQSDRHYGAHVDLSRRFGDLKQWGVRFNGIYRDGDTAVDGQSREFSVATLGLDYRGENLRTSLDLGYQNTSTQAPTGAGGFSLFNISTLKAPQAEKQISQDWEYAKNKGQYVLFKAEYDIADDWTVYGAVGANWNKYQWLASDLFVFNNAGDALAQYYYFPGYNDRKSAQAGIRGQFSTGPVKHQLDFQLSKLWQENGYSFGNEYGYGYGFLTQLTNIYNSASINKPSLAGFSSSAPKTNTMELPTIALSDTLSMLDNRLSLILGVRHQQVKTNGYDLVSGARLQHYDESAVTPSVALVVRPLEKLSLYASYIEGLSQGPTASAGTINQDTLFPPIKSKQAETGIKLDLGRLAMSASVFQIEQPSGIRVSNGLSSVYRMAGEQRNRGLELNVFGELSSGVRILGGAAWTEAKLTHTENGVADGNHAPGVPRKQANLGLEWDPLLMQGLTLSGRIVATGRQYLDTANQMRTAGWSRLDVGARYKTTSWNRPLVLRANIENLFGRDYWSSTVDGNWLIQGLPRTVMLSATVDF
ncbi:TonB-dependent receptor [Methylobacillus gramineus]|uniref:TonB-dependent receptor n=1 Tax=Methylobacillus gramineus TaxID=755169 RepID=UPI001D0005DE|nr:TonB-dependent receptor [Methylobacillus gramineus]MCB5185062.1 TonB-dependent receptor [Methylobacillus gramineus]